MLTVPTTTRRYRRNLPKGWVGEGPLTGRSRTAAIQSQPTMYGPGGAVRAVQPHSQLPTATDLPIAA